MNRRDPVIPLRQILKHSREAVAVCSGKTRPDLDSDRLLNLAATRLIEIIGEAASRLPDGIMEKHPEIPWLEMIAARNRLMHGYESFDFDILWVMITRDLPVIIRQLETLFEDRHEYIPAEHIFN